MHEADPHDAFLTYGIALEHAKLGQLDQALAWLNKTLQIDPGYCYAYFQKGRILSEQGQTQEARQVLEEGIRQAQQAGDTHAAGEIAGLLETIE